MARVQLTDDAKDDIRGLDGSVRTQVLKDLKKLEVAPSQRGGPLGSRNSGNLTGLRKLYVGPNNGYRAVFAAEGDNLAVVMVVAARADAECYEMAVARLMLMSDQSQQNEMVSLLKSIMGH
ncbi:type II toxin-antitoxin system RelE/ParE family toxin [Mycobacterium sp. SVM_VP21]|nr:type II toxin-antitoxin system RelE/ParE family toxin [Mycobacterium sp. SVM_VP21]